MSVTELNMPVPARPCYCQLEEKSPDRISFQNHYTHVCGKCGGGITHDQNDSYNQYYGFSGYDEQYDH